MGINFTEAIRKSNIAKQKVVEAREDVAKTKSIAEEIKKALEERGVDTSGVNFEDLPKFIKEANIGGGTWERPKEWLDLPVVEAEEDVYWEPVSALRGSFERSSLSESNNEVKASDMPSFLEQVFNDVGNLSQVETGLTEDGVFKVSANDFAYVMLCEVREDTDNIIQMGGGVATYSDYNFGEIRSFAEDFGLTDLFIQIDDEAPVNLLELMDGSLTLPTTGKCKDIAITSAEPFPAPTSVGAKSIYFDKGSTLYVTIGLDYNEFSDDTKMKNGSKQCIVKIWGNGFLPLYPMHAFNAMYGNLYRTGFSPLILADTVRVNDCVLDVVVCDANICVTNCLNMWSFDYRNPYLPFYELTRIVLSSGFGECVEKVTLISSLNPEALNCLDSVPYYGFIENGIWVNLIGERNIGRLVGIFNNYCNNIREIDCAGLNYYSSYYSLFFFLNTTPMMFRYNAGVEDKSINASNSVTAKSIVWNDPEEHIGNSIPLEKIVFPDFKEFIEDNSFHFAEFANGTPVIPFTLNLSTFTRLNRDSILDLISKLPTINLTVGEVIDEFKNANIQDSSLSNNVNTKELTGELKDILLPTLSSEFRGNVGEGSSIYKFISKYLFNTTITSIVDWGTAFGSGSGSLADCFYVDMPYRQFVIVSTYTYKQLTKEDLKLAEDKGWSIINDVNSADLMLLYADNTVD